MKRWLFLLTLGVIGAFLFRTYAYEGIYIASASMEPTLAVGRHVIVNKFVPRWRAPRRGDIVMFESPLDARKGLIKRVIALEGDSVELRRKKVYVNGVLLDEPYTKFSRPDEILEGDNMAPMTVPPANIFVLGDNRDVSGDSRDWKDSNGNPAPFLPIAKVQGYVR